MLIQIGAGIVAAGGLFALVVATRPAEFRVARTITVAAPAAVVFANLNDLHRWRDWSPYEGLDPALRRTYGGSPSGVGATYGWEGNAKAGAGTMTVTESIPGRRIAIELAFTRPFKATNQAVFTLEPAAGGNLSVTWALSGNHTFMSKAFTMFVPMDKLVGGEFERGLAKLKTLSESQAAAVAAVPSTPVAAVSRGQ
jgi:uncharacterized protein YndB with AHSA1/START domain